MTDTAVRVGRARPDAETVPNIAVPNALTRIPPASANT
jgi:hypothetical protein